MPWHGSRAAPALCLRVERQLGAELVGRGPLLLGGSHTPNPTSLLHRWVTNTATGLSVRQHPALKRS